MKKRPSKQNRLLAIVDFLNSAPHPTSDSEIRSTIIGNVDLPVEKQISLVRDLNSALNALRPHLVDLLAAVAELPGGKAPTAEKRAAEKRRFEALCKLTWAINSQGLLIHFQATATKQGGWRVQQVFFPPNTRPEHAPKVVYCSLAQALASGELELLRRCPYCHKFFLALKDRRARFCPGHMRLYYDDATKAKIRKELSRSKHSS